MKKWIAEHLIVLAIRLDVETVIYASFDIINTLFDSLDDEQDAAKPKGKAGRPLGSKDKQPRKRPVRKGDAA
jgi:hypothetical protein